MMNENRVNNIMKNFEGVGPVREAEYTNQEIVDKLIELQKAMLLGVYEKTHAEHMREKDLMRHFAALAGEHGLDVTDTYKRFAENMKDLGHTVGGFIKGMNGEKIARRALKLLSFDKDVKILYNIALADEDAQAEYDAIVLAPYGLFVVEVKNWSGDMFITEEGILCQNTRDIKYDLPGRMSIKEGLLREYVGELFPEKYQGIVIFSDENTKVLDEYKKMPICYGGGIVYKIRDYAKSGNILSIEQIKEIEERILNNHKEQKAPCKVNCEEIIEDYALLMATIEDMAEGFCDSVQRLYFNENKEESEEEPDKNDKIFKASSKKEVTKEIKVKHIIGGLSAGVALGFCVGAAVVGSIMKARR